MPERLAVVPGDALDLGPEIVATAGTWERRSDEARFIPRFATVPGTAFAVIEWLDPVRGTWRQFASVVVPDDSLAPSTFVEVIDPRVDMVPANLLRFSVTFSSVMEEGSATGHVHLLDENGIPLLGTLLEMPPELWDREHRRLTVLVEPGRIKRGLQPHEQAGPPLRVGDAFTFVVDANIRDSTGSPLIEGSHRSYRVGPPIRSKVDPADWKVCWPDTPGEPLGIRFERPLDRALVYRYLQVVDARGRAVKGRAELDGSAQLWTFTPNTDGEDMTGWSLRVDGRLEDVAGNSVRRVFDRDLDRPEDDSIDAREVILTRAGHPTPGRLPG